MTDSSQIINGSAVVFWWIIGTFSYITWKSPSFAWILDSTYIGMRFVSVPCLLMKLHLSGLFADVVLRNIVCAVDEVVKISRLVSLLFS